MNEFQSNMPKASSEFKLLNASIKGLFNQYDYEIDFSQNNISILIGPNGTGKTTILELLSFVFAPTTKSLEIMLNTPFKSLSFSMNNGCSISIEKICDDSFKWFEENIIFSFFKSNKKISSFSFEHIADEIRNIQTHGFGFRGGMKDELLSSRYGMNENFLEKLETHIRIHTNDLLPDEDSFQFIRASRLDKVLIEKKQRTHPHRENRDEVEPLTLVNKAIKELYIDFSKEYTTRLTSAAAILPKVYLEENVEDMSYSEFTARHIAYKEKIKKYTKVGLINFESSSNLYSELSQPFNLNVDESLYNRKKDFLISYLKVFEVTLGVFEIIYDQINLFINIFNKRNALTKKEIKCSTQGIEIISKGHNDPVPLDRLSSGEKHDLLMFYELIFGSGEIIFIDEPEISLHIEWQTDFIEQLIKICGMNNCQVVLTTHSPYIVNGHDELIAPKQVIENE